jgi:hypothetical protein
MAVNLRLTHAVKDRVVQNFQLNASELLITFVDGSTMAVKKVESNSPPLHEGARIRQIAEDGAKLLFECEDDSTGRFRRRRQRMLSRWRRAREPPNFRGPTIPWF